MEPLLASIAFAFGFETLTDVADTYPTILKVPLLLATAAPVTIKYVPTESVVIPVRPVNVAIPLL